MVDGNERERLVRAMARRIMVVVRRKIAEVNPVAEPLRPWPGPMATPEERTTFAEALRADHERLKLDAGADDRRRSGTRLLQ
jgi:hypothetical protein